MSTFIDILNDFSTQLVPWLCNHNDVFTPSTRDTIAEHFNIIDYIAVNIPVDMQVTALIYNSTRMLKGADDSLLLDYISMYDTAVCINLDPLCGLANEESTDKKEIFQLMRNCMMAW